MIKLSTSEVWTSKVYVFASKNESSKMEVGKNSHGFCGWSFQDFGQAWFYKGNNLFTKLVHFIAVKIDYNFDQFGWFMWKREWGWMGSPFYHLRP